MSPASHRSDIVGYPGKRQFDVLVAVLSLILLSPIMVLIAALIAATDGFPIFYRGERVGLHGRPFHIVKYRTMTSGSEGPLTTADFDPRVTRVGRWLRSKKLDELPQLFHVVSGTMSIVGPRPEMPHWVELYSPEERRILLARPGLTDFASLRYHNLASEIGRSDDPDHQYLSSVFRHKNHLRMQYIDQCNFRTDVALIRETLKHVWGQG